ncbi:hypothetical protein [Alteromonas stellipolaris]|jgi:hypothetical protein|uniref:hypothetical protein n=2 Tax=Alteromonas stellipolaris TaxID=233316 RepID=UPI0024958B7A|nr:hypothetical protein [Alteromonas stellipolaris]
MKESFRVWFIFEITCYSLPVCLAAGLSLKIMSFDSPFHVLMLLITFFIGCCGSVYAVANLMLYVFGNKQLQMPKLIGILIIFWLICWLVVGYSSLLNGNIYLGLAFLVPILVVLHLGYLANGKFKSKT